jgi:hypothetical protein
MVTPFEVTLEVTPLVNVSPLIYILTLRSYALREAKYW